MRYTVSIEIDLPREQVVRLVSDPAGFPRWLRGLVSHEPVSGQPGEVGTRSRVVFRSGEQQLEAVETITRRDPADPADIASATVVHYDREIVGAGMSSVARERFTEAGAQKTLWESENEYRFDGLLMKVVGLVMPGAFRKQSRQHLEDFKAFAEQGTDVRGATG